MRLTDWASPSMYTTLQNEYEKLLAGRTTPQGMAKAVQPAEEIVRELVAGAVAA